MAANAIQSYGRMECATDLKDVVVYAQFAQMHLKVCVTPQVKEVGVGVHVKEHE